MAGSEKNTEGNYQDVDLRQLVVLVRYKPGNASGLDGAAGMLGGVAGAASAASSAVETVASYVPGFIKEEKDKDKKSDKEYNYFQDYAKGWDKQMKDMDNQLLEMNEENNVLVYDYESAATESERKQEATKLYAKIQSKISGWNGYTSAFHFIGLGQGGNMANEAAGLLADQADIKNGKWKVASIIYVGTPLYRDIHTLPESIRGNVKQISLGNRYDLTQQAIEYFEPADKLRKYIEECNADLFSYFTGNIMLRLVKALSYVLGDHEMGVGKDNSKVVDAIDKAKGEITGMIEDITGLIKKLANEAPGMIKLDQLPKFGEMLNGLDAIPGKAKSRITNFVEDDLKKMISGFGVSTENLPIEKFFNCMVPLFNKLTDALKIFSFESPTTAALVDQLFEKAGVQKVYAPAAMAITPVEVDDNYARLQQQKLEEGKPELGAVMVSQAKNHIADATKGRETSIKDLGPKEKAALAGAITCMSLSMLPTKKALYAKLLSYLPLGGPLAFLESLTADKAAAPLKSLVGKIRSGFEFDKTDDPDPDKIGLQTAINRFDGEMKRVKGYLDSKNYPVDESLNSLYFIYNSHNLLLKDMVAEVREAIDGQTHLATFMRGRGYEFDRVKNAYVKTADKEKQNVKPVQPVKEEKAA